MELSGSKAAVHLLNALRAIFATLIGLAFGIIDVP